MWTIIKIDKRDLIFKTDFQKKLVVILFLLTKIRSKIRKNKLVNKILISWEITFCFNKI